MEKETALYFENIFLELKKQTLNEMKREDSIIETTCGDDVDQSLNDRERALTLKLLGRHSFMLKKIEGALLKIKNGNFGICEECEGSIEINRLKARPVASHCIACKEEQERNEGQVLYENRSHTVGKGFNSNVIPIRETFYGNEHFKYLKTENI